jgi:succinoglycan biosynthesis protein ExoA
MTASSPLVTVILPIRNEARYIARCLESVVNQDYPRERVEILVVDGMSEDGTRDILAQFADRDPRVRLIDNPQRIVPTALNRGIRAARGEIVIRVDGHAIIAGDYVRRCVQVLSQVNADCVGGPIVTVGETWMARGIAIAQSSPFGAGSAAFRYANTPQYVDTLAFGAYRRQVFDRIGLFDEELVRNQDDEFNYRLIRAGGKIWLDPAIRSDYFSRASLRALWKQYFEYGFWKVRVIQKHGRPASWRHLVPAAFVLALAASAALGIVSGLPILFLVVVASYAAASLAASLWLAVRRGLRYLPLLPLAFATMHLAYGVGFIGGLVYFGLFRMFRNAVANGVWTS